MLQNLEVRLQEKGIRPTAMRLLVLDYLLRQIAAISLNDMEAYFLRSDRVTLYRTLKTFEERGLVHRIDDGGGSIKYALCPEDCSPQEHHDMHVHFYCTECRETFCLSKSHIPEITLPDKFKTREVSLLVKGVCATCDL